MESKTVFVTGATSGFGAATARKFLDEGHRVVVSGRRLERLSPLVKRFPDRVLALKLDVRDREAVFALVESLPLEYQAVDILVNNAGLALGMAPAHQADLEQWETMVQTNINGLIYCTRALLPGMVARGGGHVINVGSVAGAYPYPGANVYGATKAFVEQFSLNLRADLVAQNIRVTNIEPGLAETEFSEVRFSGNSEQASDVYAGTEPIQAKDVAEIIYFAAGCPDRVNINRIEFMAGCQACAPFNIVRGNPPS